MYKGVRYVLEWLIKKIINAFGPCIIPFLKQTGAGIYIKLQLGCGNKTKFVESVISDCIDPWMQKIFEIKFFFVFVD